MSMLSADRRPGVRDIVLVATVPLMLVACANEPVQGPPNEALEISSTRVLASDTVFLSADLLGLSFGFDGCSDAACNVLNVSLGEHAIADLWRVSETSIGFSIPDTVMTGTYLFEAELNGFPLGPTGEAFFVSGFTSYLERDENLYSAVREWVGQLIGILPDGDLVVVDPETLTDARIGVSQKCDYRPDVSVGLSYRPGAFLVADRGACPGPTGVYEVIGGTPTLVDTLDTCGVSSPRHLVEMAGGTCLIRAKYEFFLDGVLTQRGSVSQSWLMHLSPGGNWALPTSSVPFLGGWPLIRSTPPVRRVLYPFFDASILTAATFSPGGDTLYYGAVGHAHPMSLVAYDPGRLTELRRRELDSPALALALDPNDPNTLLMITETLVDSSIVARDGDWVQWGFRGRKNLELIDTRSLQTKARLTSPPTPMMTMGNRWTSGTVIRAGNRAVYYVEPEADQRWRFDLN